MKIAGAVIARMASSRFYGKILAPIMGKPALWHSFARIQAVIPVTDLYLISTDDPADLEAQNLARSWGADIIIRPNKGVDVALGYGMLHEQAKADMYIISSGDGPLTSYELSQEILAHYDRGASWVFPANLPEWLMCSSWLDVCPAWYMELIAKECDTDYLKNHPGDIRTKKPELFPKVGVDVIDCANRGRMFHRLTLDWPHDWAVIAEIYRVLWKGPGTHVSLNDAMDYLDKHPELSRYNRDCPESQANRESLVEQKADTGMKRFLHQWEAGRDDRNKLQNCTSCEMYLGYVREENGSHYFITPDVTLKGNGKVKCTRCGKVRIWKED
ncbi:MAG: hypothetical protein M0R06_00915 [Sphaerochaeta sp.]|jgi:spore coat polysaccharide biosynthesis protein SpsF (cytidylyltransferase family)|nr:hypothetical protein [Sphaerochaeta sp.]